MRFLGITVLVMSLVGIGDSYASNSSSRRKALKSNTKKTRVVKRSKRKARKTNSTSFTNDPTTKTGKSTGSTTGKGVVAAPKTGNEQGLDRISSSSSSSDVTSVGTTDATGASVAQAPKPLTEADRWSLLLNSTTEFNAEKLSNFNGDGAGWELVRLGYKVDQNIKVSLAQQFSHSWGTPSDGTSDFAIEDGYIQLDHSNLGKLPGDISSVGRMRLYYPTSRASQKSGELAQLRGDFTFKKKLNKTFSLAYVASPRYYFQRYLTDDAGEKGTRHVRYAHYLLGTAQILDNLTFGQAAGIYHTWHHGDSNAGVGASRKDVWYLDSSFYMDVTSKFTAGLGIYSLNNDLANGDSITFFNGESVVYLDLVLSL